VSEGVLSHGYYSNQSSWPFEQVPLFAQHFFSAIWKARQAGGRGSGSNSQKEAVESQTKAAEENQRRQVLRHEWKDGGRQRNL
jgi:hypothetical protein